MRKTIISTLCDLINEANNIQYPQPGYYYFADVKGDGRNIKSVYIVMSGGGVVYSSANGSSRRKTAENLRIILSETLKNK